MWSSEPLWPGLLQLLAWYAAAAVVVGLVVWWARRRQSKTLALTLTRIGAGFMLGLTAIGIIAGGINRFSSGQVWLEGGVGEWADGNRSLACASDVVGSQTVFCGGPIDDVAFLPRLFLFLGALLGLLAMAAIVWSVYSAALLAGMGEPFHPAVPRWFRLAAFAALAGVLIGDVVTSIGMTLAARTLDWGPGIVVPFFFEAPAWPFAVSLGLFALSAIFTYGGQLQREKEGLQRETEGLV